MSTMNPGDYVLIATGPPGMAFHVVGRVGCGAAVLLGTPRPGHLNLDVNMGVVHLPQAYRADECTPLADTDPAAHGLCPTCHGWGLTTMHDTVESVDVILDGHHGDTCPACHGSGRVYLTIDIVRTPDTTEGHLTIDPATAATVTCPACAAAIRPTE